MPNSLEADGPIKPPLKNDGSFYRYCMYFEGNRNIIFSDDLAKMIARLIPGYDRLGLEQQDAARVSYLRENFTLFQTNLLQGADYSESEILEILTPKEMLPEGMSPADKNMLIISNSEIENAISLKYDSEYTFLESLNTVGHISFFTA